MLCFSPLPLSLGHPGALVPFLLLLAQGLPSLQTHRVDVLISRGLAASQALLVLRQPELEALQRRGVLLGGSGRVRLLFQRDLWLTVGGTWPFRSLTTAHFFTGLSFLGHLFGVAVSYTHNS